MKLVKLFSTQSKINMVIDYIQILILVISSISFANCFIVFLTWNIVKSEINYSNEKISILIPARNEESKIIKCISKCLNQSERIEEIIVYDDNSDDNTFSIVKELSNSNPIIKVIKGKILPQGWSGKNHACFELSKLAKSKWLLFIDADTELLPNSIPSLMKKTQDGFTFISAWPKIQMKSFSEKLMMPLLNFVVFTFYPTLINKFSNKSSLGLAHGACILVNKDIYKEIGGHSSVKEEIFEDTLLARKWRESGYRSICINGMNIIQVRMYESLSEIWKGFEKNAFLAFKNPLNFFLFQILHIFIFNLPVILIPLTLFLYEKLFLTLISGIIILLIRLLLSIKFKHPIWSIFLHPIPEIFFTLLSFSAWIKFSFGNGITWKNRTYKKSNE